MPQGYIGKQGYVPGTLHPSSDALAEKGCCTGMELAQMRGFQGNIANSAAEKFVLEPRCCYDIHPHYSNLRPFNLAVSKP